MFVLEVSGVIFEAMFAAAHRSGHAINKHATLCHMVLHCSYLEFEGSNYSEDIYIYIYKN